jgi:hypothetical protein
MVREFLFLDTFRFEFKKFMRAYDLPTAVCDEDLRWNEFLKHYAGVVEDGSLSCTPKPSRWHWLAKLSLRRVRWRSQKAIFLSSWYGELFYATEEI